MEPTKEGKEDIVNRMHEEYKQAWFDRMWEGVMDKDKIAKKLQYLRGGKSKSLDTIKAQPENFHRSRNMKIIHSRPPNFSKIISILPKAAHPHTVFAYNGVLYIPSGRELPPELIEHESLHLLRQGNTQEQADEWWERYLLDRSFRYNEELLAHRAEYLSMTSEQGSRHQRRAALKQTSKRLSSGLYGGIINQKQAAKEIKGSYGG